ncbi:MAG: hypothetical protein ACTS73_05595 [Arsenophonus sp. NEOnobi-MAG3]
MATAKTLALFDANPVYFDVCHKTYNLDPQKLEAARLPSLRVGAKNKTYYFGITFMLNVKILMRLSIIRF